jgi:hypothetical protein
MTSRILLCYRTLPPQIRLIIESVLQFTDLNGAFPKKKSRRPQIKHGFMDLTGISRIAIMDNTAAKEQWR